jgi:hypothetical protein
MSKPTRYNYVIKFVSDLGQVSNFLSPPIKLTHPLWYLQTLLKVLSLCKTFDRRTLLSISVCIRMHHLPQIIV